MASKLDLAIFAVAPLLALLVMTWQRILHGMEEVRANWTAYRCNLLYMPFAGIIQPEVGASENFNRCVNGMAKEVLKVPLDSIQRILESFTATMQDILDKLNIFRELRRKLTGVMLATTTSIMGKLTGIMSVFAGNLQKIMDALKRMAASGYVGTLFAYTMFMFIKTIYTLLVSIIRAFIIAMLVIAAVLALFNPMLLALVVTIAALFASAGGFSTF